MHNPVLDMDAASKRFDPRDWYDDSGPRRYYDQAADDPMDLWKPPGSGLCSVEDVCRLEHVRGSVLRGETPPGAVATDVFV